MEHYGIIIINYPESFSEGKGDTIMENKNINIFKGHVDEKISIEELKTLFAHCLQIEHLNFLIGAGCSSCFTEDGEKAIPIMSTLTNDFYSMYKKENDEELHSRG